VPAKPLVMPVPRDMKLGEGRYVLPSEGWALLRPDEAADLLPAVDALQRAAYEHTGRLLKSCVTRPANPSEIAATLTIESRRVGAEQGYQLRVSDTGIKIRGNDPAGVFYGVQTLVQLLRQYGRALPYVRVTDRPTFPRRGLVLDISRDKVPTMATLRQLVEMMASFKLNELQLYAEHTFAYRNHSIVWEQASPMTADEIRELDALCARHHIDLVPNQNSFGHFERWLKHKPYRPLAECPRGAKFPWGRMEYPFSLSPAVPGALELLSEMYAELLPNFSSRFFNVGCDETFDLGQGQSKALRERIGLPKLYLGFLLEINKLVAAHGRTMMFWGDIIMHHPELVAELPRDIIALEWGYEANSPFDRDGARFAGAGVPFYVCPGTSSWCSIAGRTDNCLGNLRNAAENGSKHGASGYLVTAWGDAGHWDPLPVSYLGLCYGAAASWCPESSSGTNLAKALGLHAFGDPTGQVGHAVYELGNAYRTIGRLRSNASWLWWALMRPLDDPAIAEGIEEKHVSATRELIARAVDRVSKAKLGCPDAAVVRDELAYVGRLLDHACRRIDLARAGGGVSDDLARDMNEIVEMHRAVWLARNRPGGMKDSSARLERLASQYRGRQ